MLRRVARGFVLALAPALLALAPADAGAGTVGISPAGANADSPRIALDAAGDAFATWTLETSFEVYVVQAAIRPAGGAWQAPVVISDPSKSSDRPAIAVDPAGDAVVVWQGLGSGSQVIGAALHPAGGAWQAPTGISEPGQEGSEPAVAISSGGEATAVWQSANGSNRMILAASHPGPGPWSAPSKISSTGFETSPTIAVNANGGAVAAWVANGNDIAGAARRVGSKWSGPTYVPYTEWEPSPPYVGLDQAGDAVALWGAYHDNEGEIRAALLPAGGSFKSAAALSSTSGEAIADGLVLDEAGNATGIWTLGAPGSEVIQTATMPAHGAWSAPAALTGPEHHIGEAILSTNAHGDELIDWDSVNANATVLHVRARRAGEQWQGRLNLSGPDESAFIGGAALDQAGNAVQVFHRQTDASIRSIEASEFPIAAPLLGAPSIPATGTAGIPVAMSLPAADELAPLSSPSWSFGDGTGAAGTAVTHSYAVAGTYAVAVGGLDVFENPFGAAGSIVIAPRAPVIGAFKQSAASWREGTRLASLAARGKVPVGTTFSFSLNESAKLSFAFTTKVGGRRVKGKCRAQTKRNLTARPCKRALLIGTLVLAGRAGADHVRFQGLLTKHSKLKPGSYTVTLTAAAQGLRSAGHSLAFTIAG